MRLTVHSFALILVLAAMGLTSATAETGSKVTAHQPIDLHSIAGTWFVIAHIPNLLERGHVASKQIYTSAQNGKMTVCYAYREGFLLPEKEICAHAHFLKNSDNRDWYAWFYHVVPIHQQILELEPNAGWLLLACPGHDLTWILARSPDMSRAQYQALVVKLRDEYGIYTDKLQRIAQYQNQENQLGFEIPKVP